MMETGSLPSWWSTDSGVTAMKSRQVWDALPNSSRAKPRPTTEHAGECEEQSQQRAQAGGALGMKVGKQSTPKTAGGSKVSPGSAL